MNYVTRISHWMQKHKFGVMCLDTLFLESVLFPPKNKKYYVGVSHPRCSGMNYVTHKSHRMQKHEFDIMCPSVPFVESVLVPPDHEK
jgi:hypothetical protein